MKVKINGADIFINALLILFALSVVLAFWYEFVISVSPGYIATRGGLTLFSTDLTLDNYRKVVSSKFIWSGYANTVFRTVAGTFLSLFVTAMAGYAFSKKYFPHRSFWTFLMIFTMFFGGGLIPTYLVIRDLHLIDSYLVMILPGLVSAYNTVIMRNYFASLPEEVEESAMIDGAGRFRTFFSIILPLSKPILATVALWLAVGHWNAWFDVLIYISDEKMYTLQVVLRRIILTGTQQMLDSMNSTSNMAEEFAATSTEGLKAAAIFVATLPIICVYPFIQRYFVKGIMVGSLKG